MKVLMIGGTALIGPHVIRELSVNTSNEVHTLTRSGKRYFCEQSHQGDRRDLAALQRTINVVNPDVVVDMIPFTTEDAQLVVSALANLKLTIPIVVISSIDVYAAYASLHRTEQLPLQPCPLMEGMTLRTQLGPEGHAYDKISVESVFNNNMENVCILRLPAIYGWPDTTRVSKYLDLMLDGQSEISTEQHEADWMFSRCLHKNAAHAIVLAVLARLSGKHVFNVADEIVYTERQWIQRIADCCGWAGHIIESDAEAQTIDWRQHCYVSTEKIRSELGYCDKYSTDEGLSDTVAFHAYYRMGAMYQKYY